MAGKQQKSGEEAETKRRCRVQILRFFWFHTSFRSSASLSGYKINNKKGGWDHSEPLVFFSSLVTPFCER